MIIAREVMRVGKTSGFGLARFARMERRDIWPEMEKDTDRRCEQESLERDDILKHPGNYRRTESGVGRRVDEHRVDAHLPSLPFSDKPLSPPPLSPLRAIDANPLRVYQSG